MSRGECWSLCAATCVVVAAVACGRDSSTPTMPGGLSGTSVDATTDANPDGSLLKVTAPTLQSPVDASGVSPGRPVVLVVGNATPLYAVGVTLSYRFEVTNAAGIVVDTALVTSGSSTTSRAVPIELAVGQSFQWRARAEYQSATGPWSDRTTFVAPPPLLNQTNFLAFGDSITAGTMDSPCPVFLTAIPNVLMDVPLLSTAVNVSTSYPSVLQNMLASRYPLQAPAVANEGLPGERPSDSSAFSRLRAALNRSSAQVLLLQEGVNDVNFDSSAIPAVVSALRAMVREARGRGLQVFVGTLLPERVGACRGHSPGIIAPTNDAIRAMAASESATLVDLYQAFEGQESVLLGNDGLHPNAVGYQQMAQTFFEAIRAKFESPTF